MMSLISKIQIASVSDIHFIHAKTPTEHIIRNLIRAFPDNETTGEIDLLIIGGDVFDQLTYVSDPNIRMVKVWINFLLRICAKRDIMVRVVEGTPKHDRKQNLLFSDLAQTGEIKVDLKYVDTLSIEHIERFGIDVLYLPDEWSSGNWGSNTLETWREVKALLAEKGLPQVDFCVIHGAMDYHLPPTKEHLVHLPANYESITRHLVFMGHIHEPNQRGKILMNGSFDRLSHGEEHPKGHWRVMVHPDGKTSMKHHENVGAMVYKTITPVGTDVDAALEQIANGVQGLPEGSHVRLRAPQGHPILASMDTVRREYSRYLWTTKAVSKDDDQIIGQSIDDTVPTFAIEITRENIQGLVDAKLIEWGIDPTTRSQALERLMEVIDE